METAGHQYHRLAEEGFKPRRMKRQIDRLTADIHHLAAENRKLRKRAQEAEDRLREVLGLVVVADEERTSAAPEIDMVRALLDRGYVVMEPSSSTFLSRRGKSLVMENDSLRTQVRHLEAENGALVNQGNLSKN